MGIPACLAGQSGGVSQHALQVSPGGGYPSMPCKSVPGVWSGPRGVSNFLGGLQFSRGGLVPGGLQFFGGSPILGRGLRGVKGDPPIFWGGIFF